MKTTGIYSKHVRWQACRLYITSVSLHLPVKQTWFNSLITWSSAPLSKHHYWSEANLYTTAGHVWIQVRSRIETTETLGRDVFSTNHSLWRRWSHFRSQHRSSSCTCNELGRLLWCWPWWGNHWQWRLEHRCSGWSSLSYQKPNCIAMVWGIPNLCSWSPKCRLPQEIPTEEENSTSASLWHNNIQA